MGMKNITISLPSNPREVFSSLVGFSYPLRVCVSNKTHIYLNDSTRARIAPLQDTWLTIFTPGQLLKIVSDINAVAARSGCNPDAAVATLNIESEFVDGEHHQAPEGWFPDRDTIEEAANLIRDVQRFLSVATPHGIAAIAKSLYGPNKGDAGAVRELGRVLNGLFHDVTLAGMDSIGTHYDVREAKKPYVDTATRTQFDLIRSVEGLKKTIEYRPRQRDEKIKVLTDAGLTRDEALRAVPEPDLSGLIAELADTKVKLDDIRAFLADTDHCRPPAWLKLEGVAQ